MELRWNAFYLSRGVIQFDLLFNRKTERFGTSQGVLAVIRARDNGRLN